MKALLERIESTNNNLRTRAVEGEALEVPTVGHRFVILGEPLTPGAQVRMVQTSEIKSVSSGGPGFYRFKTANSTYSLTILK